MGYFSLALWFMVVTALTQTLFTYINLHHGRSRSHYRGSLQVCFCSTPF